MQKLNKYVQRTNFKIYIKTIFVLYLNSLIYLNTLKSKKSDHFEIMLYSKLSGGFSKYLGCFALFCFIILYINYASCAQLKVVYHVFFRKVCIFPQVSSGTIVPILYGIAIVRDVSFKCFWNLWKSWKNVFLMSAWKHQCIKF